MFAFGRSYNYLQKTINPNNMSKKLIFVYNAHTGLLNMLVDGVKKTFFPRTYECSLCLISYDFLGHKKQWQSFLDTLAIPYEFLHIDEFQQQFTTEVTTFPAVFLTQGNNINEVLNAAQIDRCQSLIELIELLEKINIDI